MPPQALLQVLKLPTDLSHDSSVCTLHPCILLLHARNPNCSSSISTVHHGTWGHIVAENSQHGAQGGLLWCWGGQAACPNARAVLQWGVLLAFTRGHKVTLT